MASLQVIFEDDVEFRLQQKSALAKRISWVTYWGNQNPFAGRHYLVNNTNVIAVDKFLVVEEERIANVFPSFQAFSPQT